VVGLSYQSVLADAQGTGMLEEDALAFAAKWGNYRWKWKIKSIRQ
jgi:hypothetical protein